MRRLNIGANIGALCLLGLAAVGMAACFNPTVGNCAIQCGAEGLCPSGTICLSDGVCHGSAEESLCSAVQPDAAFTDGASTDAAIDAPSPDARDTDAAPGCGDGILDLSDEDCDDFNLSNDDGCSDLCVVELGYICLGAPSNCTRTPGPGELVLTEILKDPCASQGMGCTITDSRGEWFEVLNTSTEPLQLLNMEIKDQGAESIMIPVPLTIAPGQIMVFGNGNTAQNGGANVDFVYPTADFTLANSTDEIVLVNSLTTIEIDHVNYSDSSFPDTPGSSLSLDPGSYNSTANDDGDNWCDGSITFGDGDFGTPGQVNPTCL